MADSVDQLASLSGLSRDDMLKIWADVKANSARLQSCGRHDFKPIDPGVLFGKKYRCLACDGEADSVAVSWYNDGLRHAGG